MYSNLKRGTSGGNYGSLRQSLTLSVICCTEKMTDRKMSSNIQVTKTCENCGEQFEAKTLVTRYCSHTCNRRHYKKRKRQEKLQRFEEKQRQSAIQLPDVDYEALGAKEFLSIKEAAVLIGVSERTLYRLMESGSLEAKKIGRRTIIRRAAIDKLFK